MRQLLYVLSILVSLPALAQSSEEIEKLTREDGPRLLEIYKDLHQHPELAFMEERTAGVIAKELKFLGYRVTTGIAKTGVVGILENGDGPVVMYRADMDCNAVKEETGLPYASTNTMKREDGTEVPVMHACGHDAHMTWMLGAAKIMTRLKDQWKGTLIFVGQPAEEIMEGAKAMVNDPMFKKNVPVPDYLLGLHTWPIPVGTIYNGPGDRMAGSDQLDVTFYGIGGHGSAPEVAKDPIVMGSSAVMQYQTIISRSISAQETGVLTVGSFQAGNSNNVIPPNAVLKLNLRWYDEKTRDALLQGIQRINEGIAVANGLPQDLYPKITMKGNVFPLVNDPEMTHRVNKALTTVLPEENIITTTPPLMASEDFHHLVRHNNKTVYNYIFVGVANRELAAKAIAEGKKYPFYNHNANYRVDPEAIELGTLIGTTALLELFKEENN